jgi:hypothetical protein
VDILDQQDNSAAEQGSATTQLTWSDRQEAIFAKAQETSENLLIQAVAGSGKSTTIVETMKRLEGSSLFMAFNKAIADSLRAKVFSGDVKTLNGLGNGIWMQNKPRSKLDARKLSGILAKLMGEDSQAFKDHGYQIGRMIGLAKNMGVGINAEVTADDFQEIVNGFGFDFDNDQHEMVCGFAAAAMHDSVQQLDTFDFDDQLYTPVRERWKFPQYDNVLVDEAQDLSTIQHLMLERLGSRLFAVGDRHQAIYAFRGAASDSMDYLKRKFQMTELPLEVCYRCPELVIQAAQYYCPEIKARPGAPLGEVRWIDDMGKGDPQLFSRELILCRNNAPMFQAILRHLRAKEPCQVMSNFLDSIQGFIRGFKTTFTSDLCTKLDRWYEREKDAALAKGMKSKAARLKDKWETIKLLAGDLKTTDELLRLLKRLGDCTSGPIFSTIHKAKGLEHPDVYILRPDLMPAFYAETPEALVQENNLTYVAITRSQSTLTYGATPK